MVRRIDFIWCIAVIGLCLIPAYAQGNATYSTLICGKDTNSDGDVTSIGELQECEATGQGPLCPIDTIACTPTYQDATCPSGGMLNTATNKCEFVPSASTCPSGFTYSSQYGACVTDPACPSNFSYDASLDKCTAVPAQSCPSGYTYNPSTQKCEQSPTCLSGGSYSSANDRCEAEVTAIWTCSLNVQSYSDSSTCAASCSQTASCSLGTVSLSSTYVIGQIYAVNASGNTITFYGYSGGEGGFYGPIAIITVNGATVSGPGGSGSIFNVSASGNTITFYGYYGGEGGFYGSVGSITVNGATVSGSAGSGTYLYGVSASGNTITFYGYYGGEGGFFGSVGSIAFNNTTYTCPLSGGSACSGSPSQCTRTGSCTSSNTCPSGYSDSGGICVASATCMSGGTLNGTTDKCELSLTYSCSAGTYDSGSGQCLQDPACPAGSSFNTSSGKCEIAAVSPCGSSGYTYNESSEVCESAPVCPGAATTYICPTTGSSYDALATCNAACKESVLCNTMISGSAFSGSKVVNISASGNSLTFVTSDSQNHTFTFTGLTFTGSSLATAGDLVKTSVSGATLQFGFNVCDANGQNCSIQYATVTMSGGYATGSISGASVTGIAASQQTSLVFTHGASQSALAFHTNISACPLEESYTCSGDPAVCSAPKACNVVTSAGSYDSSEHKCNMGNTTCPLGTGYACMNSGGTMKCSPLACVDIAASSGDAVITHVDNSMYQNDGARDAEGNCLGKVYIFTGRGTRCRKAGMDTGFTNCCGSGDTTVKDTAGSALNLLNSAGAINKIYHLGQIAYYSYAAMSGATLALQGASPAVTAAIGTAVESGSILAGMQSYAIGLISPGSIALMAAVYLAQELLSGGCDQEDIETSMLDSSGYCHEVGSYCENELPLIGCVQRAKGFCCFNSKLARLVHEGGRPQIPAFGDGNWGEAESPNCRGFMAEEFQMLDFSKIDLSAYFGELATTAQQTIEQGATKKINEFYDAVQNKGK